MLLSQVNKAMDKLLQDSKLEKTIKDVINKDRDNEIRARPLMSFNMQKRCSSDQHGRQHEEQDQYASSVHAVCQDDTEGHGLSTSLMLAKNTLQELFQPQ